MSNKERFADIVNQLNRYGCPPESVLNLLEAVTDLNDDICNMRLLTHSLPKIHAALEPFYAAIEEGGLVSAFKRHDQPILLWRAPLAPKPEPVALLSYAGKTFAIPYTLMTWIEGWVVMGQVGTAVAAVDAIDNTRAVLGGVVAMMARDANPLAPEEVEFYKSHHLFREAEWPEIKDYAAHLGGTDENR